MEGKKFNKKEIESICDEAFEKAKGGGVAIFGISNADVSVIKYVDGLMKRKSKSCEYAINYLKGSDSYEAHIKFIKK